MSGRPRTLALAVAAVALTALPASADPPGVAAYYGGCGFESVSQPALTGDSHFHGAMYAVLVATGSTVTSLRCELHVDGATVAGADGLGAGPLGILPPTRIEYAAEQFVDVVEICTYLTLTDVRGEAVPVTDCDPVDEQPPNDPPERPVLDVVAELVDDTFVGVVDPLVCPVLAAAVPGGDLYIAGTLVYDCPPYAG